MALNQLTDSDIKPVTTPQEAIEQFVGEQFVDWLLSYVSHQIRAWPELKLLQTLRPKLEKIRKAMVQRFMAAEAFTGGREGDPGFLGFAIANLSESADPEAESALDILEKKREEELSGHSGHRDLRHNRHRELWIRLLKALGCTDEELSRSEPKEWTRTYIAELSDLYSNSEWQEAAGAFAAHERCVPEEYSAYLALIHGSTFLADQDMEILSIHASNNLKYANSGHILEKIVFDKENKSLIWQGVNREMAIRKDFLAGLVKLLEG